MPIEIKNSTDIYRKTPITKHSREHILQAGLGCDLQAVGLIDHELNNAFGGTIDKVFIEDFALVRALLGLETRRGDAIRIEATGGNYDLRGDKPVPRKSTRKGPPWQVTARPDGRTEIAISADTPERAAELAKHAMRAMGKEGQKPIEVRAKSVSQYVPPIQFEIGLGGPVHLRAVAKSCFNAMGIRIDPHVLQEPAFDRLREYVLYGVDHCDELEGGAEDPFPALACFDFRPDLFAPMPEGLDIGPLDHRLVIRASNATGVAYATLELFRNIPYSILLTDEWHGDDYCWVLVADPRPNGHGYRTRDVDLQVRPALTREQVLEHAIDVNEFRARTERIFGHLQSIVEDRVFSEIPTEALKAVFGEPDGSPVTEEQLNTLAHEVARRFVQQLYRFDSETPLPPPEI